MTQQRSGASARKRIFPLLGAVIGYQAINVGALALISLFLSGLHGEPYGWMAPVSGAGALALGAGGARLVHDRRTGVLLLVVGFVLAALAFAPLAIGPPSTANPYAIASIGLSLIGMAFVLWPQPDGDSA
jgi:hypothetical protein